MGTATSMAAWTVQRPSPESDTLLCSVGGAIDDVGPRESAYPHRGVHFIVTPGARWRGASADERCIGWVKAFREALTRESDAGRYVNFIAETGDEAAEEAFGANQARLKAVKQQWDPGNVFRRNQNIHPGV